LHRHVEGRSGIVDRAADQRLHGGVAAAGIDELDVKPLVLKVTVGARDLIRHSAQELAAISEFYLPGLRLRTARLRAGNDACGERCALEHCAPGKIPAGYAGGGFIAAAHD